VRERARDKNGNLAVEEICLKTFNKCNRGNVAKSSGREWMKERV